jgi:hypothetical protein
MNLSMWSHFTSSDGHICNLDFKLSPQNPASLFPHKRMQTCIKFNKFFIMKFAIDLCLNDNEHFKLQAKKLHKNWLVKFSNILCNEITGTDSSIERISFKGPRHTTHNIMIKRYYNILIFF